MSFVSTFNHTNSMTDNIIDRDKLQEDMINRIIDGMDIDGLCQLAYDYLNENYDTLETHLMYLMRSCSLLLICFQPTVKYI